MANQQARYKVGDVIGERFRVYEVHMGGMGEVYLCWDSKFNEPVALKTFQGSDIRMKQLFEGETRKWIQIGLHPNIVRCHWMDIYDNTPFMALDWIIGDESRGTDLRGWLRYGALELKQTLKFAIDIVRGLAYAGEKSKGIVHRDLKPDNVLVTQDEVAKITDFGLATILQKSELSIGTGNELDGESSHQSIKQGNIVGTPAYMPPEQWRGDVDIDPRADIYAVGCILYEMLTGRVPYIANTVSQLRLQHLETLIPSVRDIPVELNIIISKCLAKNRDERYPSVEALLDALMVVYKTHTGETPPNVQAGEMTASDYNNRGIAYDNLGETDRAIADFNIAIHMKTDYAKAYNNRGLSYSTKGMNQEAITDFDIAIRLNHIYAIAYNNRGIAYDNLGETDRAIADFNVAIQLNPNYAKAYFNRGTSYANKKMLDQAIADFNISIRINPNFFQAYINRAISYKNKGHNDQAIADFNTALRLNPYEFSTYFSRGNTYYEIGMIDRAIADFDIVIQLNPNYANAYHNRGVIYADKEMIDQAIADFTTTIQLSPNSKFSYSQRGKIYAEIGMIEESIADFTQTIRLSPDDASAYTERGESYRKIEMIDHAIADHTEAIRLNPNFALAYFNRGNNYAKKGMTDEAIKDYDIVIRLLPKFEPAYYNRAMCYTDKKMLDQAIIDFDMVIRLDPNSESAYYHRGVSFLEKGIVKRAMADLDDAIRLNPNYGQAWFNKGVIYFQMDYIKDAVYCLEKAYQLGITRAKNVLQEIVSNVQAKINQEFNIALDGFNQTKSLRDMRRLVEKHPMLNNHEAIANIEQLIEEQIAPQLRPDFETRLSWLVQIAKEG